MSELQNVPGIGKQSAKLLQAADVTSVTQLAACSLDELVERLRQTNEEIALLKHAPTLRQIRTWIEAAGQIEPVVAEADDPKEKQGAKEEPTYTDYSEDADVQAMILAAPAAIPVSGQMMKEAGISPSKVLEPILLTAVADDVDMRVAKPKKRRSISKTTAERKHHPIANVLGSREALGPSGEAAAIDISRVKPLEDFMTETARNRVETHELSEEERERQRRHKLLTATRPETNRGVSKDSRRYVKGVLHPLPFRMWIGSLVVISFLILAPLAVLATGTMLILGAFDIAHFSKWWLLLLAVVPIFGIVYLVVANGCRCRICGQKQFLPKNCLKHRNAHHVPLIGYILPTAFHILSFKWFRCIFCGTPVRIKE